MKSQFAHVLAQELLRQQDVMRYFPCRDPQCRLHEYDLHGEKVGVLKARDRFDLDVAHQLYHWVPTEEAEAWTPINEDGKVPLWVN